MSEESQQQNPFTKPGFIAAAGVIAIIVVLGIVVATMNLTSGKNSQATESSQAQSADTAQSAGPASPTASDSAAGQPSICGLEGEVLEGRIAIGPEAVWEYQGTLAYPTSEEYGPGATDEAGFRYCFQHSPEGAVFAAANAVVQGSDANTMASWLDYFLAQGPGREEMLAAGSGGGGGGEGMRLAIRGLRLLTYDGQRARVDIGVSGTANGQEVNLSMIYTLVWEDGDWKMSVPSADRPIDVAQIPSVVGYIPWGE